MSYDEFDGTLELSPAGEVSPVAALHLDRTFDNAYSRCSNYCRPRTIAAAVVAPFYGSRLDWRDDRSLRVWTAFGAEDAESA